MQPTYSAILHKTYIVNIRLEKICENWSFFNKFNIFFKWHALKQFWLFLSKLKGVKLDIRVEQLLQPYQLHVHCRIVRVPCIK